MVPGPVAGIRFIHDAALKSYDDQMRWIDALDTKAGILIAADGLLAGLLVTSDPRGSAAPRGLVLALSLIVMASLVTALIAFITRHYEVAPDIDRFSVPDIGHENQMVTIALEGYLNAIEINEKKVAEKATFLFWAGGTLLLAAVLATVYFVYLIL